MIKLVLLLSLAAGTAFYAGGRTVYSGLQLQMFTGVGLKVTPDPSNIWSFHQTVTIPRGKDAVTVPVLVDFDKNGKMDTEPGAFATFRVLITDMQLSVANNTRIWSAQLHDDTSVRWVFLPSRVRNFGAGAPEIATYHLATPLSLPMSSGLKIELTGASGDTVTINLIGRLVSM